MLNKTSLCVALWESPRTFKPAMCYHIRGLKSCALKRVADFNDPRTWLFPPTLGLVIVLLGFLALRRFVTRFNWKKFICQLKTSIWKQTDRETIRTEETAVSNRRRKVLCNYIYWRLVFLNLRSRTAPSRSNPTRRATKDIIIKPRKSK